MPVTFPMAAPWSLVPLDLPTLSLLRVFFSKVWLQGTPRSPAPPQPRQLSSSLDTNAPVPVTERLG